MKSLSAWLKAARIQSQSYIFLPILFGGACGFWVTGRFDWTAALLVHIFGLFDQLYIIFANDYADRETDRLNRTYNIFTGGSRVLVDGDLAPGQMRRAAKVTGTLALLAAAAFVPFYGNWRLLPPAAAALGLLWAYSYPPFKLSYRGGGELLQMIGVGLVLPLMGYLAQTGTTAGFPWPFMFAVLPTQLACAMSTSLPDEPSDRVSDKKTTSVLFGVSRNKALILILNGMTVAAFLLLSRAAASAPGPWPATRVGPPSFPGLRAAAAGLPLLGMAAQLFFLKDPPGSPGMTRFVFLSVAITLSFMLTTTLMFFTG